MKWQLFFASILSVCANCAYAQEVSRCVQSDGSIIYTEIYCATNQPTKTSANAVSPTPSPNAKYLPRPARCNSSVNELLLNVQAAIVSKDVNQLAKNYHWTGVSNAQSEMIMTRLEKLISRPLFDANLNYNDENETQARTLSIQQYVNTSQTQLISSEFPILQYMKCWWFRY